MRIQVKLQNTASVARDHLANERTYLAWLRTSLTFSSAGIALTQLFRLVAENSEGFTNRVSTVIGSLFVAMGITTMVMGCIRYFHVQEVLQQGEFPVSRIMIMFVSAVTFSLVVVALALLIVSVKGGKI